MFIVNVRSVYTILTEIWNDLKRNSLCGLLD